MLSTRPGADPYFAYKFDHVRRAQAAWTLAEECGLYEALRAGPASVAEVARSTGLAQRPAAILLAASSALGILGVDGGRYFIHGVMREMVLEGGAARTRPPEPADGDRWVGQIRRCLTLDEPIDDLLPPWLSRPEEQTVDRQAFAPGRHGWRRLWGRSLARAFDFSGVATVADLGGATGGVLVGLTEALPHLTGILVELPYSRRSAEAAIAEDGAQERVRVHVADMFVDPLPAAQVFFMSHVIHDWDDERCARLLERCYTALPAGGAVIVQEYLLEEDGSGSLLAVFQWFGLLLGTDGDQRTGAAIAALLGRAGFVDCEVRPLDHEQSLAVGWKR